MERILINAAQDFFNSGELLFRLKKRIPYQTVSQKNDNNGVLEEYLTEVIIPELTVLGFEAEKIFYNAAPFLIAERYEGDDLPCILMYAHGDVVWGNDGEWEDNLSPWELTVKDGKWYGRGTADNKGQHTINFAALELVLREKGKLGFNCKILFEMGEEISSPGLEEIVIQYQDRLSADIFIASDGPRVNAKTPTLFLGSRGGINIEFKVEARDQPYHSGNWGGLLSNPAIQLVHALSCLANQTGKISLASMLPPPISAEVRRILQKIPLNFSDTDPHIDERWGEYELTPSEQLYGWNSFEILSFITGNPENTVNAIPPFARAICQLRFVEGTNETTIVPSIRQLLQDQELDMVSVTELSCFPATRFDPEDPLVSWTLDIIEQATHLAPILLPNLGGSIPNHPFSNQLGLPTLWIPHSYPSCCQHGPNEHMIPSIALEGLQIMVSLFHKIGDEGQNILKEHKKYKELKKNTKMRRENEND